MVVFRLSRVKQIPRKSVQERKAFLPNFRDSIAARSIVRIAQRIAKYWNRPIKDSAALVSKHVCQLYETLRQPSVAA
jgi:hypothetical protein